MKSSKYLLRKSNGKETVGSQDSAVTQIAVSVLNSSCSRHTQPLKLVWFHAGHDTLITKNATVYAGQTVEHNL